MADSGKDDEPKLAEGLAKPPDAVVSGSVVGDAPRVQDLEASGGIRAVEIVANHFSMPLAGPPPGPSTGKLPPWWHKEKVQDLGQGDDPTLSIG